MKRFTPFGVLALFGLIGLLTGEFGLWFPMGLLAAIIVGAAQAKRAKAPPVEDQADR